MPILLLQIIRIQLTMNQVVLDQPSLRELGLLAQAVSQVANESFSTDQKIVWEKNIAECNSPLLIELAKLHGILPWLSECLKRIDTTKCAELAAKFQLVFEQSRITHFQSEYQTKMAVRTCAELEQHQVPHLAFKGVAVLNQFYSGFVSSRVSDDLDILVSEGAVTRAVEVLTELGYVPRKVNNVIAIAKFVETSADLCRWRDIAFHRLDDIRHKVDLHWRIADSFTYPAATQDLL